MIVELVGCVSGRQHHISEYRYRPSHVVWSSSVGQFMAAGLIAITVGATVPEAFGQPVSPSSFRAVARSGDPVPGLPGEVFIQGSLRALSINQLGEVLFSGSTQGSSQSGVFVERPVGTLVPIIRSGQPVPGLPGLSIPSFCSLMGGVNNANGVVALGICLTGTGVIPAFNDRCILAGPPSDLQLVARSGDAWPGARPGIFGPFLGFGLNGVAINDDGTIVFIDGSNTSGNTGLWRARWGIPPVGPGPGGVGATLAPIARAGEPAAGGGGALYAPLFGAGAGGAVARVSQGGECIFDGPLSGMGVTSSNAWGLWMGAIAPEPPPAIPMPPAPPTLLMRAGDSAPGLAPSQLAFTSAPTLNDVGDIAFGGAVVEPDLEAIWAGPPTGLVPVATSASSFVVPGAGTASLAELYAGAVGLSNAGKVVFAARLTGPGVTTFNDSGIWSNASGVLRLVAREGDPAPGTQNLLFVPELSSRFINALGQVAFEASLRNADGTPSSSRGVWYADSTGAVWPVAVPGSLIDIDPTPGGVEMRTVVLADLVLGWSGGHDGATTSLNDRGELLISVSYTGTSFPQNGSGVFVVSLPVTCHADFNGDGSVAVPDIFAFLAAWFAQDASADFDGNMLIQVPDIFTFLSAWFAGCP